MGYRLFNNLIGVGFKGIVYPVNPFEQSVQGVMACSSVKKIPRHVDLAIVATPAHVVLQVVEECGESGVSGIIIVSSGFSEIGPEGRALEEELLKLRQKYGFRIIGPNCLGVVRPSTRLNATFANKMTKPGRIAFISQSGALCASVIDWAAHANVGFSSVASIGDMIDVNFSDLIDYFGMDPKTRSIILFIESIKQPAALMSAARALARTKPIVVVKAGKSIEGMKAATTHTGAVMGEDAIYDAFFKRACIIRVEDIADLFNCSEILATQPTPKGANLVIITNAGGPGVMATDALIAKGGKLATLSSETIQALSEILPHYWSKSNPIDISEDATVDRFRGALETCSKDSNIDGYLVIYTPIGAADPTEVAETLIEISKDIDKPILACWLGEEDVQNARNILRKNRIPSYSTPEQAASTFMYMYQYSRSLELLYETPEELPSPVANKARLTQMLKTAANEGREVLTEPESKEFLEAYGIPTARAFVAKTPEEAINIASKIGYPVVMKILSPQLTHKTDVGGVVLNVSSHTHVKKSFEEIVDRAKKRRLSMEITGVTVEPMISGGFELIVGSKKDPQFGSVITFGTGGTYVELAQDISVGFPPLTQTLARRIFEQTKAYEVLSKGFRGEPPVNNRCLDEILVKFSQLIVDFPQIKETDVNPLLVNEKGVMALDARIVMDLNKISTNVHPYEHLIIRPYPRKYMTKHTLKDGTRAEFRPIRPEDEPLLDELFRTFSEKTTYFGFFHVLREASHLTLARFCNIDYNREMAIIAELKEKDKRQIVGMTRLAVQPDRQSGEASIVVGDPWQDKGLGTAMFDYILEVGKDMGLKKIFSEVLSENTKMKHILFTRGFDIKPIDEETYLATIEL